MALVSDFRAERELGVDCTITRRDFLNSSALGAGAALLGQCAPLFAQNTAAAAAGAEGAAFDGYAGVGDYASSNGNTWRVLQSAHAMRDGAYHNPSNVIETGETYDFVVVGGGFAGMGAAHRVMQLGSGRKTCLVLDNHLMWGGEAKRNEFIVNGVRLLAPQGSNETGIPGASDSSLLGEIWADLGLPREVEYGGLSAARKPLEASISNYGFQLWGDNFESHGFYFPAEKRWVTNPWGHGLAGVPWPERVKRDLLRWRNDPKCYYTGPQGREMERWLDSMSYERYLTQVMGLGVEVARYADPILAASGGLASDATSAYLAWGFAMPGFQALRAEHPARENYALRSFNSSLHRFPGGNDGIMRALVKRLVPDAITGGADYAQIHNGAVRFDALDQPGRATRIRLAATTVAVEHEGPRDGAERVAITYLRDERLHRVHARNVVMACGSWPAKHVVRGLPQEYREAMQLFHRSPMLIINVALTNWRALYRLGYTAASWRGGQLGFSFNLSPPMRVGGYAPTFDPDEPAVLTYYVPFVNAGLPLEGQGPAGRATLLSTSYREYELAVRRQLTEMLSARGFDARRDIAGIILNRWGHAYVAPYPGFYFGRDGNPAPSDIVRRRLGRIAFGHSEHRGHQNWIGGVEEGRWAVERLWES